MGTEGRISKALNITDYFVSLPPLRYFILGIVLLGILFGVFINLGQVTGIDILFKGTLDGLLILTLPALLSAFSVKLMIYKTPFKRIAATILGGEIIYAIAYAIAFFLASVNPSYAELIVIFGVALVFVLWYVIGRLVFVLTYRSFIFAGIQLLFHSAFLISSRVLYFEGAFPFVLGKFYLAALILMAALYVFFFIINAPMKRSFGIASTDAIALFTAQWLYQSKEIEKTFAKMGEKAKTLVGLLAFKREKDTVLFVVPYVHFGPFGNLGGSEFSALIPDALAQTHNAKTFVFHGTVTHDLNPISSEEIKPLVGACNEAMREARFKDSTCSLSVGHFEECRAELLRIGKCNFIGLTRAPHVTEDINFGVGLALMSEAERNGGIAIATDQHNCETGEVTSFEPGDEVSYNYINAVKNSLNLRSVPQSLQLGISQISVDSKLIGNAGIKLAAFSSSPIYLIAVLDCNGITPSFREKIIQELEMLGKNQRKKLHVAVFTTDTHKVNMVRGVLNPLGEDAVVLQAVKSAAQNALDDMQPAKFYATKKWFETQVFGAKQSIEIVSTINSIIAVAKIVAPLLLLGGIAAILLLVSKL